jgi:chorismate mutase/prephenate dehydratase
MSNNITRFFVIGREPSRPTGNDKTAMIFSTAHKVGSLVDVLQVFQNNGVNLTNIESRPGKKREMEYYFFVECQGHQQNEDIKKVVSDIRKHVLWLSVLGSFPKAIEVF